MTPRSATRWGLAAIAVLALGALWAPAAPAPTPLVQAMTDTWQLPALPRRLDQTTLAATVNDAAMWGDAGRPKGAAAPEPDTRWRIAGVYGVGTSGTVIVEFRDPTREARRLNVGDLLPSGNRIDRIEGIRVCVRIGNKTYWLGVERRDT